MSHLRRCEDSYGNSRVVSHFELQAAAVSSSGGGHEAEASLRQSNAGGEVPVGMLSRFRVQSRSRSAGGETGKAEVIEHSDDEGAGSSVACGTLSMSTSRYLMGFILLVGNAIGSGLEDDANSCSKDCRFGWHEGRLSLFVEERLDNVGGGFGNSMIS